MLRKLRLAANLALMTAGILFLYACGPGGGVGSSSGDSVVAAGMMLKGSVILNGVHYIVPNGTPIVIDDSSDRSEIELKDGMLVKLKGTINSDGTSGTAQKIESEDELQGEVQSIDLASTPQSLTVLSQTIYADDLTKFGGGVGALSGISVGDYVEVHGFRDGSGNVHATRIEKLTGSPEVELKGIVSSKTATTFQLFGLTVDFSSAVIEPSGASINNGDLVQVEGSFSGILTATKVELEDLTEDPDFELTDADEVEIQGYVSSFSAHPGSFQVNGYLVQTTSTTEFENGSEDDLVDNVKVEAKGSLSGGVLFAEAIEFSRARIKLEGEVTSSGSTSIELLGLTVTITDLTEKPGAINVTDHVKVEGYKDQSGTLIAEEIELSGSGDDIIQAPVEAESGNPVWTLTLLGITTDLSGSVSFENDNETPISRDAFFAAVIPGPGGNPGTLVKVKGVYSSGTITADQAELED